MAIRHRNFAVGPSGALWRVDFLRGVAIFAVVLVHSSNALTSVVDSRSLSRDVLTRDFFQFGLHGVQLFFLISGFLLAYLYTATPKKSFAKTFWLRRIARIWPLWLVFSVGIFLGWVWEIPFSYGNAYESIRLATPETAPLVALLLTMFFLGFLNPMVWNDTVPGGWSIQSEILNYTLFAFLRKRSSTTWLVVLLGLGVFQYLMQSSPTEGNFLLEAVARLNPFSSMVFFSSGVFLHHAWQRPNPSVSAPNAAWLVVAIGLLFLAVEPPFGTHLKASFFVLSAIGFSALVTRESHFVRWTIRIGRVSYFIYFIHFFVVWILRDTVLKVLITVIDDKSSWIPGYSAPITLGLAIAILAISWPLALLSWRFIEKPIINLSKD